jgi:hypothetical protein
MSIPARQPDPLGKAFAGSTSAADPVAELTGVPEQALPRDAAHWAAKVARLKADPASPAKADNVTGRRLTGPVQGFGSMWQKTYTVEIGSEVTPQRPSPPGRPTSAASGPRARSSTEHSVASPLATWP